jgi:hypothetical protein
VDAAKDRAAKESAAEAENPTETPREVEIKFRADPAGLAAALASPLLASEEKTPGRKLT